MKAIWNVEGAHLVARNECGQVVTSWEVGEGIEAPLLASMLNLAPAVSRLVLLPWIGGNPATTTPIARESSHPA